MASGPVLILYNPVSGGGRAERAAARLAETLRGAGHESETTATERDPVEGRLEQRLAGAAAVVIVGGDGAVRAAAGPAIRTRTPLYHVPYGTANLFARQFGMDRRPETLRRALARGDVRWVDAGDADGETFVLMASVGYDAEVVHDLARHRGASISYLTYAAPMIRQLRRWAPAAVAIRIDGRPVELDPPARGTVIVANAPRYAFGLDPAPDADMTDGLLDVVYLPTATRRSVLAWIARLRLTRRRTGRGVIARRGVSVEIECDRPRRLQLDGDPPDRGAGRGAGAFRLSVRPGVLPVLVPPGPDDGP